MNFTRTQFVAWMTYFCPMADNHHHSEPEQNEIGGPVVLALILLTITVTIIAFLAG